jgi:hypothetical protein
VHITDPEPNTGHEFIDLHLAVNEGLLTVFDDLITNDDFADQIGIDWMLTINPKWASVFLTHC